MLNRKILLSALGAHELAKGEDYVRRGRVKSASWISASEARATVKGSEARPYSQKLSFRDGIFYGSCTCYVGTDCKHVAAAGLALVAQAQTNPALSPKAAEAPLPHAIEQWLDQRSKDVARKQVTQKPETDFLHYVLRVMPAIDGVFSRLLMDVHRTRVMKSGGASATSSPYNYTQSLYQPPKWLRDDDRAILERMQSAHQSGCSFHFNGSTTVVIADARGMDLLKLAIATGRCFAREAGQRPLELGEPLAARFVWETQDDGGFLPAVQLRNSETGPATIMLGAELMALHAADTRLSPLTFEEPPDVIAFLSQAPVIPGASAERVRTRLQTLLAGQPDLMVPEPPPIKQIAERPVPVLKIKGVTAEIHAGRRNRRDRWDDFIEIEIGVAKIVFEYPHNWIVENLDPNQSRRIRQGDTLLEVVRDAGFEARCVNRLLDLGFMPLDEDPYDFQDSGPDDYLVLDGEDDWMDFLATNQNDLEADGWIVTFDPSFPHKVVRPDGGIDISIHEDTGGANDWFTLDLGVKVGGEYIDLTQTLALMIARHDAQARPSGGPREGYHRRTAQPGTGWQQGPSPRTRRGPIVLPRWRGLQLERRRGSARHGQGVA
jgi:hypothetical protein